MENNEMTNEQIEKLIKVAGRIKQSDNAVDWIKHKRTAEDAAKKIEEVESAEAEGLTSDCCCAKSNGSISFVGTDQCSECGEHCHYSYGDIEWN